MSGVKWTEFILDSYDTERTEWTERAHATIIEQAGYSIPPEKFEIARVENSPELRLRVDLGQPYVMAVRGQTPLHGMQGSGPECLAGLRDIEEPVLWLALQGDVGWGVWLVPPEPEVVCISKETRNRRYGWRCKDMTKFALSEAALQRHWDATAFRFPEAPPVPVPGGLF